MRPDERKPRDQRVIRFTREVMREPVLPSVPSICFYCKKPFLAHIGAVTDIQQRMAEEAQLGTSMPLATCGDDRCVQMDLTRQDAMFNALMKARTQKEKPSDDSKPGDEPADPVQERGGGVRQGDGGQLRPLHIPVVPDPEPETESGNTAYPVVDPFG